MEAAYIGKNILPVSWQSTANSRLTSPISASNIVICLPPWRETRPAPYRSLDQWPLPAMKPITIFSFGYDGWGNHTAQLVAAVDAVEESRDFGPPKFVDTRIRRSVRAVGFNGPAFERLVGQDRHCWMKSLGNTRILTGTGPLIQIADPKSADTLLEMAIESAKQERRVIFFCNCAWPKCKGKPECHRSKVADLLLEAAERQGRRVNVVEWPGGEPTETDLPVSPEVLAALRKGRKTVPLGNRLPSPEFLGLPWYSVVTLHSGTEQLKAMCGPAKYLRHEWCLPVQHSFGDLETDRSIIAQHIAHGREAFGLDSMDGGGQQAPAPSTDEPSSLLDGPKVHPAYTSECVYTILHSRDLAALLRSGGSGSFTERKKWVAAEKLLRNARSTGKVVPVIFAPGEVIRELTHFAELDDVNIAQDGDGRWSTKVSITNLTKIAHPCPDKTVLTVTSTGRRLPAAHIRPYVLVETPAFMTERSRRT